MRTAFFFLTVMLTLVNATWSQDRFAFNDVRFVNETNTPFETNMNHLSTSNESLWAKGPYQVAHHKYDQSLSIDLPNMFDVLEFDLVDMQGKSTKVKTEKKGKEVRLLLSDLPKGLYLLKLYTANNTYTTKVQHGI